MTGHYSYHAGYFDKETPGHKALTLNHTLCFTGQMASKTVSLHPPPLSTSSLGRRSQRESERTKEKILDEAEKLFSRLGLGASVREIAKASGVRHHTVQHHFGDKEGLYRAVLNRWDAPLEKALTAAIEGKSDFGEIIDAAVDTLFDFMLERRDWVSLTARAAMDTQGLATQSDQGQLQEKGWVQFIESMINQKELGPLKLDVGLLLITVEGITHNHVLARGHYRTLFGRDVTDAGLNQKTKSHIRTVIRTLLGAEQTVEQATPQTH